MTIVLDPTLEAAVNELARRRGVAPEVAAVEALRERLLTGAPVDESRDDWERRLRALATDCFVSLSDDAVSSEGIYEQ